MKKFTHPIAQIVHSTVRIECPTTNGRISCGTGFFYNFCEENGQAIPCIVTNKHVVNGAVEGIFHLTRKNTEGQPEIGKHNRHIYRNLHVYRVDHPDPNIDLVAFPIGPIFSGGESYYFQPLGNSTVIPDDVSKELSPMEEIVMVGYPNGIWDSKHNMPVIRKGITATNMNLPLNGKNEFLIDAACFPGSSGSPVFLANIGAYLDREGSLCSGVRLFLIGILYAGPQIGINGEITTIEVPTVSKDISLSSIPMNLGFVINAAELFTLELAVKNKYRNKNTPVTIHKNLSRLSPCPCDSGKKFRDCCGKLTN